MKAIIYGAGQSHAAWAACAHAYMDMMRTDMSNTKDCTYTLTIRGREVSVFALRGKKSISLTVQPDKGGQP